MARAGRGDKCQGSSQRTSRPVPDGRHCTSHLLIDHSGGVTTTAVIEIRGLGLAYENTAWGRGAVTVVEGLSLTVGRARVHALLGGAGSGKTAVLEAAAGLRRPDRGTVRVHGVDPYERQDAVRAGRVWRDGGLFPGLTVGEVVATWRRWTLDPLGGDEALALTGLDGYAGRPFDRLSALERRRLDLALALVGRSDVLLLDEPTAGLDPSDRPALWRTVRTLADAGPAVLVATRDLEVTAYADRLTTVAPAGGAGVRSVRAA